MQVKSCLKTYEVHFENNFKFIQNLIKIENAQFVIDDNVYRLYKSVFETIADDRLIIINAVEQNKVIDTALQICERLTEIPAKRNATLISVGGGIIQDITGFVANITYRGINWIFVPTTLLAACDSCIGGKTSLNYKSYKNLLGTFYPPDEIYICPEFFDTLSKKDFNSGLGEVIKFNIMEGVEGLNRIEENIKSLQERDIQTVNQFIQYSLMFKKSFIEKDEFDHGERIKLNFAHTFGHAIEVISDYEIPHGMAVAIGMIMADKVSFSRGYISEEMIKRSEDILLKVIDIDVDLLEKSSEDYLKAIKKDKKQVDDAITTVLICKYGLKSELSIVHDTKKKEIEEAISYFVQLYKARNEK